MKFDQITYTLYHKGKKVHSSSCTQTGAVSISKKEKVRRLQEADSILLCPFPIKKVNIEMEIISK